MKILLISCAAFLLAGLCLGFALGYFMLGGSAIRVNEKFPQKVFSLAPPAPPPAGMPLLPLAEDDRFFVRGLELSRHDGGNGKRRLFVTIHGPNVLTDRFASTMQNELAADIIWINSAVISEQVYNFMAGYNTHMVTQIEATYGAGVIGRIERKAFRGGL